MPGKVVFSVDIRSSKSCCLDQVMETVNEALREACGQEEGLSYEIETLMDVVPVELDEHICGLLGKNAEKAGYFANKTLRKVHKKIGFPERIR